MTVTGGSVHLLKSVFQFTGGSQGLIVSTGALTIEDIAFEITGASDSDGTKCLHVGQHRSGSDYEHGNASVLLDQFCCFSGAGNHGVVVGGSSRLMSRPGNASCNNFQDGWHFTEGGAGFIKFTTSNGNEESGYMSEQGGHQECDGSAACGNGQDGFEAINGGKIGCNQATTVASYSQRHAVNASARGEVRCGLGTFEFSANRGLFATEGAFIDGNGATVDNSTNEGIFSAEDSLIVIDDMTITNNGTGIRADNVSLVTGSGTITLTGNTTDYNIDNGSEALISGTYQETIQAGDLTRLSLVVHTVASAPSGNEGDIAYFSDGDAGAATLAVHDGTNWKVVSLGATIAAS